MKMLFTHSWINRKCSSPYHSNSFMLKLLPASMQNTSASQKWRISDSVTQWRNRNILKLKVYVPWTQFLCRLNQQHMVNCSPSCQSSTLLPSCSTTAETGNGQRPWPPPTYPLKMASPLQSLTFPPEMVVHLQPLQKLCRLCWGCLNVTGVITCPQTWNGINGYVCTCANASVCLSSLCSIHCSLLFQEDSTHVCLYDNNLMLMRHI